MGAHAYVLPHGLDTVMRRIPIACVAILIASAGARADLVPTLPTSCAHDVQHARPLSQLALVARALDSGCVAAAAASDLAGDLQPAASNGQVTALPGAPDSALLALSGLLSLGAVQLGRNMRKLHLGVLPEWYHEGAVQVGHSTPFDLDLGFTLAALPVCFVAPSPEPQGPVLTGAQWPDAVRCAPQFLPLPESLRAPPKPS